MQVTRRKQNIGKYFQIPTSVSPSSHYKVTNADKKKQQNDFP